MHFPVSDVDVFPLIPPIIAFVISFFTSMGGVSGAFLLLPFQVSVLGFTSPAVSATNLVYNIVAIPSGVYRYIREGRMAWPLTWVVVMGTLPGVFIGAIIRVKYLPDPKAFKLFVGCVLFYIGIRLIYEATGGYTRGREKLKALEAKFKERVNMLRKKQSTTVASGLSPEAVVKTICFSFKKYEYEFWGESFSFNTLILFTLAFIVGIIGGIYGIGGGAIIAPFCVTFFGLPIYTVAGAALMGTFLTSIAGVGYYSGIAPIYAHLGMTVAPDWLLGFLFGVGGFLGMYCGARVQKFIPERMIRLILGLVVTALSLRYILQYFI